MSSSQTSKEIYKGPTDTGHLPPGLTTLQTLAKSKMPKGISRDLFLDALNASTYVYYYSNGSKAQSPANLHPYCERLTLTKLTALMETPEWAEALYLRGIAKPTGRLTEQQILALSVLTNVTSSASLKTRLDRVGVPYYQFMGWLKDPIFANALRTTSEGLLQSAQALVDLKITEGAINAKSLEWIKYFKEVNGSAPKQGQLDTGALLRTIVDIVTKHVTDPDQLRAIGADLSVYLPTFSQLE